MAEMIGPELDFEAVDRPAERRCHDAGVGDDGIETPAVSQQLVGAGPNTLQGRQIELDQLQAAACAERFGLSEILTVPTTLAP